MRKGTDTPATPPDTDESINQPLGFELQGVDCSHEYFRCRGIKLETAKYFGVGYFSGRGSMSERIVIPIHNEKGELIAYSGRATDDEQDPKYKLPKGFNKSLELFNFHRVIEQGSRFVILVEGYFGTMKIHQAGFPHVV